jgi:hypothetical protein
MLLFPFYHKKRIELAKIPLSSGKAPDLTMINGALKSVLHGEGRARPGAASKHDRVTQPELMVVPIE